MSASFKQFCIELGAPLHNPSWSWSALSKNQSFAVFTVWEDGIHENEFEFSTRPRVTDKPRKPGRPELISNLELVLTQSIPAYGIKCVAKDMEANPRVRAYFDQEALLDIRVSKREGRFYGKIVGTVPPDVVKLRGKDASWIAASAINDLLSSEIGNDDPEYHRRMSGSYVRDEKVRRAVLKRANGRCEECGELGFVDRKGKRFLETHHIISLSEQGADKPHNVIALCPNHHRQAHFGSNWKELQDRFLAKLDQYRKE